MPGYMRTEKYPQTVHQYVIASVNLSLWKKTNMDTQNDGLEKADSLEIWPFLVSMFDFWGVVLQLIFNMSAGFSLFAYFKWCMMVQVPSVSCLF